MITIYGRQFHTYPIIDMDAKEEDRCVGCSFHHEDATFCGELMQTINHVGCGNDDCVFVLDDPQHIANYLALRMGAKDE